MKKAVIFLAALLLLCGCGKSPGQPENPAATTASTAAASSRETEVTSSVKATDKTAETERPQVMDEGGMMMLKKYEQIDQEQAKQLMAEDNGHIIVDVRRQDEYDSGHIPGAVLIPNETIGTEPPAELPERGQIILVYCRSGRRSKEAAQKLADMGYTRVYEFGGIIDWSGDIVTDDAHSPQNADGGDPNS